VRAFISFQTDIFSHATLALRANDVTNDF